MMQGPGATAEPQGSLPTLPCLCPWLEITAEVHGQHTGPQNIICAAQVGLLY